ncbi:MAG TPA: ATP-binding protein [Candidatus Eisenbacteria bacterium]|nr:ATP-binding protein [Candidatus Eisenbacteria bacterium]
MTLPVIALLLSTGVLGFLTMYFFFHGKKLQKELAEREVVQKRRVYEISVLKTIQERIGYSLDIERVIDTLTGSLKNLFPYSTVSSIVVHDNSLVMKTTLEERVGTQFLESVKKSMLASLSSLLSAPLPTHIEEVRTGLLVDEVNTAPLSSFFHIPLIVNGAAVGLISICSTKPGLYKEEDMTIMYQITATASSALTKLKELIVSEQEKLMAMITSLADGIVMIDNSYKLTFINSSAKNLLGIPHLTTPTIFDVVNMLSKEKDFGQKIKDSLSQNKIVEEKELHLVDKTVQVIVTPVLGPVAELGSSERKVMGVTVLIHDITLEVGLQQMKEDFTNAVVHELRSPLTAIKAASEMMVTSTDLPQSEKKLAQIIDEQSKRLLNDINSLLDAAKLEAGHFSVWQAPNDISKVAMDALALFHAEAEKKHITLDVKVEDTLPQAFIDSMRIAQVLNNLLSNSLKFTPAEGKITVKIVSQYNNQLPKTSTNPGILVSVSDTGIGIPADKQKKLFAKFSQINPQQPMSMRPDHPILSQQSEGTGLGLYIAKGIVEAHGGNMYVNSSQETGTTIFFTLPVAQEEQKTLLNPKLQNVLEQYTPKVLN